jgi:hypothetical protein
VWSLYLFSDSAFGMCGDFHCLGRKTITVITKTLTNGAHISGCTYSLICKRLYWFSILDTNHYFDPQPIAVIIVDLLSTLGRDFYSFCVWEYPRGDTKHYLCPKSPTSNHGDP